MTQKAITVYTPDSMPPHIFAEDDAQMHRGKFGGSGILQADNMLACSIVDNNTIRLQSGMYCNQGYLVCIPSGRSETFTLVSGTQGAFRKDLLIAEFTRGGGDTPDSHVFSVVRGTEAASLASARDPELTQQDLSLDGTFRQEALYRVIFNGVQIVQLERVSKIIAVHAQMPVVELARTDGEIALQSNAIYRLPALTGATVFQFPAPTPGNQDQIMLYLTVGSGASVLWPAGCIYVLGLPPLFREGRYYRVVCEYDPNAGVWCVGAIESEAARA